MTRALRLAAGVVLLLLLTGTLTVLQPGRPADHGRAVAAAIIRAARELSATASARAALTRFPVYETGPNVPVQTGAPGTAPAAPASRPSSRPGGPSAGIWSYQALESLWVEEGGNPAYQAVAACIAEHESSGDQYKISPTGDYGLWQIHAATWGWRATLDPYANARSAVFISHDGTDWSDWTTHADCGV